MLSRLLKLSIPHLIALGVFLLVLVMFFSPQLQGKKLPQGDITSFKGMSKEIVDYRKETGRQTYWTNAMFGGMPAYQISMDQSSNLFKYVRKLTLLGLTGPIAIFFAFMLGGYLALVLLNVDYRIAIVASLAFAFSTYNILLLEAGHNSKINTVGYLGMMLSGIYLVFQKKRYIWGGLVFAIATALAVIANHIQMTYYFLLTLLIYGIILVIREFKNKDWSGFGKSVATIILAGVLGLLTSSQRMLPTYEFQGDTMRGKPILTSQGDAFNSSSSVDGLNWTYAMRWSHAPIDLLAMIMPKAAGGGNETIKSGTELRAALAQRGYGAERLNLYWGGLDFTGGPAYYSVVLWFFLLYFVIASKHSLRWWTVASLVLLGLMSLGKYFGGFNQLLFDTLPLLNKFRAPGSIATVIAIPLVIGGALGMHHFFLGKAEKLDKWKSMKWTGIGLGGFLVLATIIGLITNSFSGLNDANYEQAGILDAVVDERQSIFLNSGIRSLFIAALSFLACWAYHRKWLSPVYGILALGVIVLGDLWQLNKNYLPNSRFAAPNQVENPIRSRPVDDLILKDTGLYFRVHDLTADPFRSSTASYFHKTIGGYNPAKLLRYQDIIDRYLSNNDQKVLNMLNTRYIITSQNGTPTANVNAAALGNAWYVNEYIIVQTPENEINGINGIDPEEKAIIHNDFAAYMQGMQMNKNGTIELTAYAPDKLTYKSNSSSEQLAIFSEIWYGPNKGWNAYVDGNKVDHIRANYLLRAMRVPAGEHTIEFRFEPRSVRIGSIISLITSIGLIGSVLGLGYLGMKNYREPEVVKPTKAAKKSKSTKQKKSKRKN